MIQDYVCKFDGHEDEKIQGFCLSSDCKIKYQWCVQCFTQKHSTHPGECKSFNQIKQMIKNYSNIISDWIKNTNDEFNKVQQKYSNVSKFLENEKNKMIEFEKQINEKKYKSFQDDIQHFKTWKNISQTKIINDNIINMLNQFISIRKQIDTTQNQFDYYAKDIQNENKEYVALKGFEDALKENPQNSSAWCEKGWVLSCLDRDEEAIYCCDQAIKIDQKLALAYGIKGGCLSGLGNYDEGIKYCDQALSIDSQCVVATINKGFSLDNLKRYDDAIKCYDQAINLDPNNTQAYNNKGILLNKLQRYEDAIKCLDQAISLDPKSASAYNNKGFSLNNMQRYEDAIKYLDSAISLDPKSASAYNNKGFSLKSMQRYQDAIKCYDQAISLDPNDADYYVNKSDTLKKLGKHKLACQCKEKAEQLKKQSQK